MPVPLLTTKLYIPPPRPKVVTRPRLLQRLDEGLHHGKSLTLVSAPAGYGKSMLIAEWFGQSGGPERPTTGVTWLSLDENDNDPVRFLTYLIAALQRLDANIGQSLQSMLGGPQLPSIETLMTGLINDITETGQNLAPHRDQDIDSPGILILALDDYHKISLPFIHETIQFLLDHKPPPFHLVLITREDPPLSIPRMRVRGEITEVRAQDLRFNVEEAVQYFNQVMQLNLTQEWIRLLEVRTEGWIAGLQLAALSLQGRSDIENFVEDFHGSHRYVIDYLMDEVMRLQTEENRQFLYQTSILKRFSASLCEAVTGRKDSQELLARIEQSNLFLISLDERREWYRYHHLFSDFLRLGLDDPLQTSLHQRASKWFEENGYAPEAIEHALSAKDYERAGQQIETAATRFIGKGELSTVLGWLNALPDEIVMADGNLLSHKISCLYFTGHIEEASRMMAILDEVASTKMDPLNQGRLISLKAWNANAREEDRTISLAQEALSLIGDPDPLFRAITLIPLGHAYRRKGELAAAAQAYREAIRWSREAGHFITMSSSYNSLALLLNEQAKRKEAIEVCQVALQSLVDRRGRPLPVADLLCLSQSVLAYEANELDQAVGLALKGREASQRLLSSRVMGGEAERVLIRAYAALGDSEAAEKVIWEVRQQGTHLRWIVPQIDALKAELSLRQGDLESAAAWARTAGISSDDLPVPARELSYFTYARLLLAQGRPQEAKLLLDRMEGQVRKAGQDARLITILILQCLTETALGDRPAALRHLEEALKWAAPGGYLRRFLDEGEAVRLRIEDLRLQTSGQQPSELHRFMDEIANAFSREQSLSFSDENGGMHGTGVRANDVRTQSTTNNLNEPEDQPAKFVLLDPLSAQELKVLRLLCAGLSNQEIAAELVISVGTAKWHVHNIYSKLGVNSRTQAIARAQDLKII